MSTTKTASGTQVDEIAAGIFRIHTPVVPSGASKGFSFNQILVRDDRPLLFHTGPRSLFPAVAAAIGKVLPLSTLKYIACSHFESDECGAMNEFLTAAPQAEPLCGKVNAMVNGDSWDRKAVGLADQQTIALGQKALRWIDAPHLPHGWECGYLMDHATSTLLCGDLFTQAGSEHPAVVTSDILEPSEAYRKRVDYFAHIAEAPALLEKLAAFRPTTLACMHGSAWQGDGAALLRELALRLEMSGKS